jgi:hypothetical protein
MAASSNSFRSSDLGVMGPARYHCAMLLLSSNRYENKEVRDFGTGHLKSMPLKNSFYILKLSLTEVPFFMYT